MNKAVKEAVNPGQEAPSPLGVYSHAVRVGDILFISGQGCRDPKSGVERGLTLDAAGNILDYDIEAQTEGVLENLGVVLRSAGLDYQDLVDMTVFLADMNDFARYNKVYARYFQGLPVPPSRTTVQVAKLPGRNFIEIKAVAAFTR